MSVREEPAITILLHEYDSLRAEILSRYRAEFQIIGAGTAYLVGLLTVWLADPTKMPLEKCIGLGMFGALVGAALYAMTDVDVTRASWRIQEIEKEVNLRSAIGCWCGKPAGEWGEVWGVYLLAVRALPFWVKVRRQE